MRQALTTITVAVAALVVAGTLSAQTTRGTKEAAKATTTTSQATAMGHSAAGKLAKFDPAAKMLTLSTAKGEESFTLGPNATIREGSKTIAASDLANLAGHQVKVRYSEAGGQKTVESVMVSAGPRASTKTAK